MPRWTSGARRVARSSSWRRTPDGCWAASASVRPRPRCTRERCTCIRASSYVVDSLDPEDGIAFVHAEDPGYATFARELTDIAVTGTGERSQFGPVTLGLVPVTVTHQVVGYLRRRLTGEVIDFIELDMPGSTRCPPPPSCTPSPRMHCCTTVLRHLGFPDRCMPPSTRPLACCRWWPAATAATSAACPPRLGPDGLPSVFVYDGYPGGAGFAERGFRQARTWLGATAAAIEACECPSGCPSCVQSPKCGNGNDPLDKAGAVLVLRLVLAELAHESR